MRALLGLCFSLAIAGCAAANGGENGTDDTTEEDPGTGEDTGTDPGTDVDTGTGSTTPGVDSGTPDTGSGGTKDSGTGTKDSGSSTPPTDSGSSTPPTDSGPPTGDPPVSGVPLANGVTITQVAVNQGVQIPIEKSGSKVTSRNADVVANRAGLVRVYVSPKSGFSPHAITGELKLESSSGTLTYSATLTPSVSSSDATLSSTMNFDVPTDAIKVDSKYSVTLYDSTASGGDTSGARYPSSGTESIDAKSTGSTLKIVIVPIAYNADGSGRLPDTSAAQIERYRQAFYGMYPARSVSVTVRAPYAYSGAISASGSGFSNALTAMQKLRQSDGVAKDVYYYGAFANASSFSTFCGGGCVTGLCGLSSSASDATVRACVGVGFTGVDSAQTAAHEVGHAHGRNHSPCGGASGTDPSFPYTSGSIGAYGYDLNTKVLYSPSKYKDIMSYCQPYWVSDYTYEALLNRMAFVGGSAYEFTPFTEPQTYRYVDVHADGTLSWGDTITLTEPPQGTPHTVTWEGADGAPAGSVTGSFYPFDHLDGGYMLVPEPPKTIPVVRIGDVRLLSPSSGY